MADEARAKRAAALEEKKRRLEALKARRTNRAVDAPPPPASADAPASSAPSPGGGNLDDYIDGLLSATAPAVLEPAPAPAPAEVAAPAPAEKGAEEAAEVEEAAPPPAVAAAPAAPPARRVETFTCGTQTEEEDFPVPPEDEEEEKKEDEEKEDEKEDEADKGGPALPPVKALSPEEVEETVRTAPFSAFLNSASKRVERLLGAPVLADLLVDVDYAGETDAEAEEAAERDRRAREAREGGAAGRGELVRSGATYECARWTSGRDCTDLDWSPVHRELMLASYHAPLSASAADGGTPCGAAIRAVSPDDTPSASLAPRPGELQSDGLALVWSLAMPGRPEHIFTCGSPVLTGRFHPTEHHLVVGGCQSGQVVVWDIRAGRLPVQRSSMAAGTGGLGGHAHPICAMEVVEGGSGLVTAATDGRLNFWSLANLRDPAESFTVAGNVSCLAVAPESNTLLCGDETGGLHTVLASTDAAASASGAGSRRTARRLDPGEDGGHFGMVTAASTKAAPSGAGGHLSRGFLRGAPGLVLTCGVDWTTRLWAPAYADAPLLTLPSHSYDYMCDVQWSPSHPAVFATAGSNGTLGLWNLASSLDEPVTGSEGITVDLDVAPAPVPRGLNRIRWSHDGRRIAAASSDRIHVLGVADEVYKPKADDEGKMMANLSARGLLDEL